MTVTDTNGATATCGSTVIVLDTTPPTISWPAPIVLGVQRHSRERSRVQRYGQRLLLATGPGCFHASVRLTFPIGTTTVTSMATDAAGNHSSCAFQVTWVGAQGVLSNVLAELTDSIVLSLAHPTKTLSPRRSHNLTDSLDPALWVDQTHLSRAHGEQVFNSDKAALQELSHLLKGKKNSTDEQTFSA